MIYALIAVAVIVIAVAGRKQPTNAGKNSGSSKGTYHGKNRK